MTQGLVLAQLWLAIIMALIWGFIAWRRRRVDVFPYPTLTLFGIRSPDWRQRLAKALRYIAVITILAALARPQWVHWAEMRTEGIDIVIALDISGSMMASDFQPNRMEAAKNVIRRFVELLRQKRSGDRLGLVVFAAESYTQCPLTDDYDFLLETVAQVQNAREGIVEDGTAIGDGLRIALARLRQSPAKSKVSILISDGMNNAGSVQPKDAARFARSMGVRVYTIGIGTKEGMVRWTDPFSGRTHLGREAGFDEPLLRSISYITNGSYFYARDPNAMNAILRQILQLETAPLVVRRQQSAIELATWLIAIALFCLFLEGVLIHTFWQKVP